MTDLQTNVPDTVPDDVELFEEDGIIYGRDEHGEFQLNPMAGSDTPVDGRCNWVLKFTEERYGQTRYCTGMPESTFVDGGSDYCKHHKSADALMEHAEKLFKHGYFATNYVNFAQKLDATKFLFAVEMVGGLFEMSTHEFEVEEVERTIDSSDSNIIEEDAVDVALPIPQANHLSMQANELWTAALKEVMVQNMNEAIFSDGVAVETLAQSADMEGQITDTITESTEHHLHLPVSRVAKDIKEHLQNGGVTLEDDDGGVVTFQKNDYTLSVEPSEAESADTDAQEEFAFEMEDDAAEIEL